MSHSIQQRIGLASPGDTLLIEPGVYHQSLVTNKKLTLTTANPAVSEKPVIDADGATYGIKITSSDALGGP